MNYEDIINSKYFKDTYSKIEEIKKDFPVNHGFIHVNNVIENAKRLAITFNLNNKQKELLLIASALHDVGYLKGRDDHAYEGGILAREYLNSLNLKEDDINIICNAIKNHGGKKEEDYIDKISMCLIIADKLDFINTRYSKEGLKEEYLDIFPHITSTVLEYQNNKIILNIIVTNKFSINLFESSSYYNKLNVFLSLLSKRLNSIYLIKYKK